MADQNTRALAVAVQRSGPQALIDAIGDMARRLKGDDKAEALLGGNWYIPSKALTERGQKRLAIHMDAVVRTLPKDVAAQALARAFVGHGPVERRAWMAALLEAVASELDTLSTHPRLWRTQPAAATRRQLHDLARLLQSEPVAEVPPTRPCGVAGCLNPATCGGMLPAGGGHFNACDEHCSHAQEDGYCEPYEPEELAAAPPAVGIVEETDPLRVEALARAIGYGVTTPNEARANAHDGVTVRWCSEHQTYSTHCRHGSGSYVCEDCDIVCFHWVEWPRCANTCDDTCDVGGRVDHRCTAHAGHDGMCQRFHRTLAV